MLHSRVQETAPNGSAGRLQLSLQSSALRSQDARVVRGQSQSRAVWPGRARLRASLSSWGKFGFRRGLGFSMVQVWCVLLTHDKHDGMHEQPIGVKRLEISLARTSANATGDERERGGGLPAKR